MYMYIFFDVRRASTRASVAFVTLVSEIRAAGRLRESNCLFDNERHVGVSLPASTQGVSLSRIRLAPTTPVAASAIVNIIIKKKGNSIQDTHENRASVLLGSRHSCAEPLQGLVVDLRVVVRWRRPFNHVVLCNRRARSSATLIGNFGIGDVRANFIFDQRRQFWFWNFCGSAV